MHSFASTVVGVGSSAIDIATVFDSCASFADKENLCLPLPPLLPELHLLGIFSVVVLQNGSFYRL